MATRITLLGILLAFMGNGLLSGAARADYGPQSYDSNLGKGDIVCVGSDTLQFLGNFMADGSPYAHAGVNAANKTGSKLISIDATADATARFSYSQTQTFGAVVTPSALDPTVVLRAQTFPAQRPNGSGAGYNALLNDTNTVQAEKINCVRGSSYPSAANFSKATAQGWVGLHVVRAATETLAIAVDQAFTNAPPALSRAQLIQIYQGVVTQWSQLPGGYSGPCPTCTIVPLLPQPGSGTRNTFLADLQAANGGIPIAVAANVQQNVEENDPTSITNNADPADAIVAFSGGRLNLWNGLNGATPQVTQTAGPYFHNPHTAYNNNPFPGGATLSPGVLLVPGGAGNPASDTNPGYADQRGLFVSWRESDTSLAGSWQSAGPNWVNSLFLSSSSFLAVSFKARNPVNDSGATYAYVDCGVNVPQVGSVCANNVQ